MVVERKGQQFRVRVEAPSKFKKESFRTLDVGEQGGLQFIRAKKKREKQFSTQAIRVSTKDFRQENSRLVPKTSRGRRELATIKRNKQHKKLKAFKKRNRGKGWFGEKGRHSKAAKKKRR